MQILNLQPVTCELITCNTQETRLPMSISFVYLHSLKIEGFILHDKI